MIALTSRIRRILALLAIAWGATSVASAQDMPRIIPPRIIIPPTPQKCDPVRLTEMDVVARIVGLNAEVTTTMTFFNPNKRQLEGELVFPLPEGAGVTGYALDVNGQMVDGVVVKKEKARVAFETEVRRGVDPGLVEQVAGNVFRTRVYPLPPGGARRIRVRSVAPLTVDAKGDAAWNLPMPIGETIEKLTIKVEVSQGSVTPQIGGFGNLRFESFDNVWVAKTELTNAKPGEDLWVALPKLPAQVASVQKTPEGDTYFSVSDLPTTQTAEAVKPLGRLGIAWDASGSRAGKKHLDREIATLKNLLAAWPETKISLLVFRDRPEEARDFGTDRDGLLKALEDLACDGGTDLAALPESMRKTSDVDEWLLVTDGLDTLSDRLPEFGKARVNALVSQTVADRALLDEVCSASGGQAIDLQAMDPAAATTALTRPPLRLTRISGTGISEVQGVGQTVHGRAAIYGKLSADEAKITLEYSNGFRSPPIELKKSGAPEGDLLASVWAARRIRQLALRAESNEDELLTLGRRFGIVSPVTSLIVLENLDQYVRNEIEPPASLAEMRRQWNDAMARRTKESGDKKKSKFDQVLALWKERVKWWETDFKVKPGYKYKAGRDKDGDGSVQSASAMLSVNEEPAPASRPAAAPPAASQRVREEREVVEGEASGVMFGMTAADKMNGAGGGGGFGRGTGMALVRKAANGSSPAEATITVKPWDPKTPYLRALKDAKKEERYKTYLSFRKDNATSPAFFLDCSDFFFREGDSATGSRILSNLAELKIEDAALLRVMAWRFQQAGELDRAITLFRKVPKWRPEEPQSLRDLALALAERGKSQHTPADLTEAMNLLEKMVFGEWQRFEEIELVALEELNALIAWVETQKWDKSPEIPALDPRLKKNLDLDMRIVMSWDADATDVDLHVLEPSGEEASYNHNRTHSGGIVSRDFTQGYGPEEYLVRKGLPGDFKIFAHYYGSSQQTLVGPATITATVFTNFGRPSEKKEVLTLRLDKPREKEEIGKIHFAGGDKPSTTDATDPDKPETARDGFSTLKPGTPPNEVVRLLGEPGRKTPDIWTYQVGDRKYLIRFSDKNTVESVVESLPGGAEMILSQ